MTSLPSYSRTQTQTHTCTLHSSLKISELKIYCFFSISNQGRTCINGCGQFRDAALASVEKAVNKVFKITDYMCVDHRQGNRADCTGFADMCEFIRFMFRYSEQALNSGAVLCVLFFKNSKIPCLVIARPIQLLSDNAVPPVEIANS